MFESLFGEGTPLAVRFFIAFVVVFGLIGISAWLIRRFGSTRLGGGGARGRQPRLAVIEAGAVDGRRRLVLIRRDNVEHLLMIGGPADIVVEQNIVRGQPARGSVTAEPAPRGVPGDATTWPLAPEPGAPRQRPAAMEEVVHWNAPEPVPPVVASPAFTPNPIPPGPRRAPQRPAAADTLGGLANELSRTAPSHDHGHAPARTAPSLDMARDAGRDIGRDLGRDSGRDSGRDLRDLHPARPAPAPDKARPAPAASAAVAATAASAARAAKDAGADGDQNLTDMAQRLEAALRRPGPTPGPTPPATPAPSNPSLASAPRIDSVNGARDKAAASEPAAAPAESGDAAFGSLEQEMASLLGRPSGKE